MGCVWTQYSELHWAHVTAISWQINVIVFDKTGTLTVGKPRVVSFQVVGKRGRTTRSPHVHSTPPPRLLTSLSLPLSLSPALMCVVLTRVEAMSKKDLSFLAGSAEKSSEHVLGRAIEEYADQEAGRKLVEPIDFVVRWAVHCFVSR